MQNKTVATENDINSQFPDSTELEKKMIILAQEMDLFNQRLELIERGLDSLTYGLEKHMHNVSGGQAMFPMRKQE